MSARKSKEFLADLALVAVAVVWGVTFLPMAQALHTNGVFTLLFWRFLMAFFLMVLISLAFVRKIDANSIKYGAILGVFLFAGFAFQTFALKYALSSSVAFITGLNVVFVPFIVFLFFKQKVYIYSFAGAFLSAIGLYFLSSGEFGLGLGELLSVICAFAYALQIVFTGVFVKRCELYALVCMQFLTICALSLICAVIFEGTAMPNFDTEFYKAVIITAVFATVFAFFVQNAMQRYTTPMKTSLIFTLEPVSAGVLGYFVGGERFSALQIGGALVILAGILLSEIGSYYKNKGSF